MSVIDMTVFEKLNARIKALEANAGFLEEDFEPLEASVLSDWMCEMEDRIDCLEDDAEAAMWADNSRDWRVVALSIAAMACLTVFIIAVVLS